MEKFYLSGVNPNDIYAQEIKRINEEMKQRNKQERENSFRDEVVKENLEEMAKNEAKKEQKLFEENLELLYFQSNPNASKSDWEKDKKRIVDNARLKNFEDASTKQLVEMQYFYDGLS